MNCSEIGNSADISKGSKSLTNSDNCRKTVKFNLCDFTCLQFPFEQIGYWLILVDFLSNFSMFSFAFTCLQDKIMLKPDLFSKNLPINITDECCRKWHQKNLNKINLRTKMIASHSHCCEKWKKKLRRVLFKQQDVITTLRFHMGAVPLFATHFLLGFVFHIMEIPPDDPHFRPDVPHLPLSLCWHSKLWLIYEYYG